MFGEPFPLSASCDHGVTYLVTLPGGATLAERASRHEAYRAYLESARERMPPRAFEFATAEWHYDPEDHRCPHDAWVKSLIVSERALGSRQERRSLEVELTLLGAYHDGVLTLTYPGVRQYSLFQPPVNQQAEVAHGDWLADEIEVADASRPEAPLVVHHILFSGRGVWTIEAQDILCEWRT